MTTAARRFALGDQVPIPLSGTLGSITGFAGEFCATCHCNPADHYDGTLCCPGPWYQVAYTCPEGGRVVAEIYAEHELAPAA